MSEAALVDIYRKQKVNLVPIPKGSGKALDIPGGWKKYQYEMYTGEIPTDQDFAVILGNISGKLIVLDFDQCDDLEELNNIKKDILNSTLVVRTGDGYHAYFTVNELPTLANTFLKKGKYKMEVKGEGAYVIGAGCIHYDKDEKGKYVPTGKYYKVVSNTTKIGHLKTTGEKVIEMLKLMGWESPNLVQGNGHHIIIPTAELEKGKWQSGERYNNGFKLALRRFHMGWEYDDILNEAYKLNQSCEPPHNEIEVERWVNDAHTQYQKNLSDPNNKYFKPKDEEQKDKKDIIESAVQTIQERGFRFKAFKDTEELLVFDGVVYRSGFADAVVKEECEKIIKDCKSSDRTEVINKLKAQNFVMREQFDSDPNLLTLNNCILNIETMKTIEHSPNNLTMVRLPVSYDPEMSVKNKYDIMEIRDILKDTLFLKYLTSCFTIDEKFDEEQFVTVLEIMAICFIKKQFDKAFMFIGAGANGKSVLLDYLESMLGEENVSNVPIHDIELERFAKAELYGKMANIFADIESNELNKTGNLKLIISGDSLTAEKKHQQPFKFKPYTKLIFSANKFPMVRDQSDGFFRRFVIVNWKNQFLGERADPTLRTNLIKNMEEKNLVFNLLIRMARNLNRRGKFIHEKTINELRKEWNKHSDPIILFIDSLVDEKEGSMESKTSVYKKYREFCINNEIQPDNINKFGRIFGEYYESGQHKGPDGINRKVWLDIEVKEVFKQACLT